VTDPLRNLADDGLYLPRIKEHSLEKIRIHNYFVRIFATAMKAKWHHRAYVGLYSGAGRARLEKTGEIVETSALSAVRIADPFSKYIFVDQDARCTSALEQRISALRNPPEHRILTGDVNVLTPDIRRELPKFSRDQGLLSFCFVDPFAADLQFDTLRALSAYRMDLLILLMLGLDARLNFKQYLEDENDNRIALLIDDPEWRADYRERADRDVVRYILQRFNEAMVSLGYQSSDLEDSYPVRIPTKEVLLYSLVYYSKHPLGASFWKAARSGVDPQLGFDM
jgi:three-Cys-motif partner protein